MKMQLTNPQETVKFITLLNEGLQWLDAWTPTIINNGGCGVFSAMLSDKLSENGIEHEIVTVYFSKDDDDYHVPELMGDHIVIRTLNNLYFDNTGLTSYVPIKKKREKILTRTELEALIRTSDLWRRVFDRDCIPEMKDRLDTVFDNWENFKPGYFAFPETGQIVLTEKTQAEKNRENPFARILESMMG